MVTPIKPVYPIPPGYRRLTPCETVEPTDLAWRETGFERGVFEPITVGMGRKADRALCVIRPIKGDKDMVTAPQVTLFIAVKAGSGGASVKFGSPINVTIKAELLKDEDNVLIGSSSDKEEADNELYAPLAEQLIRLIWKGKE